MKISGIARTDTAWGTQAMLVQGGRGLRGSSGYFWGLWGSEGGVCYPRVALNPRNPECSSWRRPFAGVPLFIDLSGTHGEMEAQWGTLRPTSTDPSPGLLHELRGMMAWLWLWAQPDGGIDSTVHSLPDMLQASVSPFVQWALGAPQALTHMSLYFRQASSTSRLPARLLPLSRHLKHQPQTDLPLSHCQAFAPAVPSPRNALLRLTQV